MKKAMRLFLASTLALGATAASAYDNKPALNAGAGGGSGSSASYKLLMTLGQPASANLRTSGNYGVGAGFLQALLGFESLATDYLFLNNDVDNYFCLERAFGSVCITVPAGAYAGEVTFIADIPTSFPAARSNMNQLVGTPIGVRTRTVPSATPSRAITYDFTYNASALTGVTDEANLSLMRHLPEETRWLPVDNPSRDQAAHKISIRTPNTGTFQALEILPGAGVGDPFVYPNPFMAKNGDTVMRITNIPANAKIEIFTVTGRAVRNLTADHTGLALWDVRNNDGTKVASGIYLAIVRARGEKRTIQLAVQR